MIFAALIFFAVVLTALILIHRDNQRIIKHHQDFIQQQIKRLRSIK